jgi:hypothetical protein
MGPQTPSFQVRALLTCWHLTDKAPGEQNEWPYTQCTAVRQIAYRRVLLHNTVIETSYANRASEVYQMALVTVTI